jgi:hypothetical protein
MMPAHTVAGLSIKLQLIAAEAAEGDSAFHRKIIETAFDVAERLAPGSVIYRPKFAYTEAEVAP